MTVRGRFSADTRASAVQVHFVRLVEEAIAQTEVEVVARQITFMGSYLLDLKVKMTGADEAWRMEAEEELAELKLGP